MSATVRPHGDETRYCAGCRCDDCRAAHAAGARRRRRNIAYGRHVPKSVPNTGAKRRVQALMCLGWSMRHMSRALGWHPDRLSVMLTSYDGISPRNHARIAALYNHLWDKPAPQRTTGERITARRTIALAERMRYLPPLAWDDETIDVPETRPFRPRNRAAVQPCGTDSARRRHYRRGEKPCAACIQAGIDARRAKKAAAA